MRGGRRADRLRLQCPRLPAVKFFMPKHKGKLRGALPPAPILPSADQSLITSFIVPSGVSMSKAEKSPRPGSEASLSPIGPSPPPKPAASVDVQSMHQNSEGKLIAALENVRLTERICRESKLAQEQPEKAELGKHKVLTKAQEGATGTVSKPTDLQCLLDFPVLKKTAEVSMENIWLALELLYKLCSVIANQTSTTSGEVKGLQMVSTDHQVRIQKLETQSAANDLFNVEISKDKMLLHRKIETLENANRSLNLRLLNFPVSKTSHPKEMFFKFLKEVMEYQESSMPILQKIYFLPTNMNRKSNEVPPSSLDISAILEQSTEEITQRETLLVSFVFNTDKELFLRSYFKRMNVPFFEENIRIYPDVSKWTQSRRKKFLAMRMETIQMGAKFLLSLQMCGFLSSCYLLVL